MQKLGFMIKETGQALDRLGCRLQGSNVHLEDGKFSVILMNDFACCQADLL